MKNHITKIQLKTEKDIQFFNITEDVKKIFNESDIKEGTVNIFTTHTTCAIKINEWENELLKDMNKFMREIAPKEAGYGHDKVSLDGRNNAHSHLLGLMLNASETIPVHNGEMLLGIWQAVLFIEMDGPRGERNVFVQVYGD
ncbi:secondary thiamine-phosphate synthase enzyme YjbQ [bacterium]|nr:secondary thiamine-phosphate synthase enzyme YjbQ [bacterium]